MTIWAILCSSMAYLIRTTGLQLKKVNNGLKRNDKKTVKPIDKCLSMPVHLNVKACEIFRHFVKAASINFSAYSLKISSMRPRFNYKELLKFCGLA